VRRATFVGAKLRFGLVQHEDGLAKNVCQINVSKRLTAAAAAQLALTVFCY
jgi:hypothetical protein